MASIPDVNTKTENPSNDKIDKTEISIEKEPQSIVECDQITTNEDGSNESPAEPEIEVKDDDIVKSGVKASDDTRYRKYFKMLQFGVPAPAVKLKMQAEGFDPNVLE